MQIFVNTVESLNSPVYSAPPCTWAVSERFGDTCRAL